MTLNLPGAVRLLLVSITTVMAVACSAPTALDPQLQAAAVNAPRQGDKPYLVLVSIDGFRWDFAGQHETPTIDRLAASGLSAKSLQPVFPTLTFPNHYSIATGLLPVHHGIVANQFPASDRKGWYWYKDRSAVQDGNWYAADPIWVTAEKHGMLSAAFYFVGTEADVSGIRPTHWRAFDGGVSGEARVRQVLEWLEQPPETRPHMITLYFEDVDDYGHLNGPGIVEIAEAIRQVDRQLGLLLEGIEQLPHGKDVYVLLVSDHGMGRYDPALSPLVLDRFIDLGGIRLVEGGPYVFMHFDRADPQRAEQIRDEINSRWTCGEALLPADAPAHWAVGDSPPFPDVIVLAKAGCGVLSSADMANKITPGDHGWPPESPDMQGVFYAMGPRIPPGTEIGVVHVTDIYPLMLEILGLPAPGPFDGDPDLLPGLLLPAADGATGADSRDH
jgi:predicted AlkP superfamily pyrophosphatase or phosphodiesterase